MIRKSENFDLLRLGAAASHYARLPRIRKPSKPRKGGSTAPDGSEVQTPGQDWVDKQLARAKIAELREEIEELEQEAQAAEDRQNAAVDAYYAKTAELDKYGCEWDWGDTHSAAQPET